MENKGYTLEQEQIARFAKAMGHPARIAILEFLARQNCCFFGDIHEELPIAKATVSQHLKELKEAGLIQGKILYQSRKLENRFYAFFSILRAMCMQKGKLLRIAVIFLE